MEFESSVLHLFLLSPYFSPDTDEFDVAVNAQLVQVLLDDNRRAKRHIPSLISRNGRCGGGIFVVQLRAAADMHTQCTEQASSLYHRSQYSVTLSLLELADADGSIHALYEGPLQPSSSFTRTMLQKAHEGKSDCRILRNPGEDFTG